MNRNWCVPMPVLAVSGIYALLYAGCMAAGVHINAVALTIVLMVTLCFLNIPVPIALIGAAVAGGLHAGLSLQDTLAAFNDKLLTGAQVGMSYVMVGAFAVALARSGLLEIFAAKLSARVARDKDSLHRGLKWGLFAVFMVASILSQNVIPVHIAFIPILIPPLLAVMNRLQIDRRAVACVLACAISCSYLLLPVGFGAIYLNDILLANVNEHGAAYGMQATAGMAPKAMFWPVMGIVAGMLVAVFITYRKPRIYAQDDVPAAVSPQKRLNPVQLGLVLVAIAGALIIQMRFDSLLIGAMVGFVILSVSGIFRWQEQDDVFTQGVRMMAQIAVIITLASGFAGVLNATGEMDALVKASAEFMGNNKALAAFVMLAVGLFITIGFGDSFASVPILAPIYIPLAMALGFSPPAAMSLLGAAAALGDAGSPASTITLGATAGLNADGRHDHIRDSVLPTFMHANFGMLLFAWAAAMVL